MKRRDLDFTCAEDVIRDVNHLRTSGYSHLGQWNLSQVCEHLTATMKGAMDGFGFRLPWVLRATILKWAFRYFLKRRRLRPGAPTFRMLKPKHTQSDDDDTLIDECIQICQRVADFQGPIENYPLLDNVNVDEWRDFMWIHAAHHLGFLVPRSASSQSPSE